MRAIDPTFVLRQTIRVQPMGAGQARGDRAAITGPRGVEGCVGRTTVPVEESPEEEEEEEEEEKEEEGSEGGDAHEPAAREPDVGMALRLRKRWGSFGVYLTPEACREIVNVGRKHPTARDDSAQPKRAAVHRQLPEVRAVRPPPRQRPAGEAQQPYDLGLGIMPQRASFGSLMAYVLCQRDDLTSEDVDWDAVHFDKLSDIPLRMMRRMARVMFAPDVVLTLGEAGKLPLQITSAATDVDYLCFYMLASGDTVTLRESLVSAAEFVNVTIAVGLRRIGEDEDTGVALGQHAFASEEMMGESDTREYFEAAG
jgi:hypothetical protein